MKPLKHLVLLTTLLVLFSCQKEHFPKPLPEAGYPFTYHKLDDVRLSEIISIFNQINDNEGLTINPYGFVQGCLITNNDLTSAEGFILALEELIIKYNNFMGIADLSDIDVKKEVSARVTGGVNTPIIDYFSTELKTSKKRTHYFSLPQKYIENQKIDFSEIIFALDLSDNKIEISGHWFPNAKIPLIKIYSKNEAIGIALKNGEKDSVKKITATDENTRVEIKIIPVLSENSYELHESWCVTFWDIHKRFYIDTQTGDLLRIEDYSSKI